MNTMMNGISTSSNRDSCDTDNTYSYNTNSNNTGTNTNTRPQFEVYVNNDTFKFNAAHFVAYQNYRERLHGHNYHVSVKLIGSTGGGSSGGETNRTNNNNNNNNHSNNNSNNSSEHHFASSISTTSSSHTNSTPILGPDGYLIDFSIIKQVTRKICKELNEHFICPMYSNVLDISTITLPPSHNNNNNGATTTTATAITTDITSTDPHHSNGGKDVVSKNTTSQQGTIEYIQIICHMDSTTFIFPKKDCILLPIVHATAEELAIYIYCQILNHITIDYLYQRNIICMEISVAEAPTQRATFRHPIPYHPRINITTNTNNNTNNTTTTTTTDATTSSSSSSFILYNIDVRQFIMSGNIVPVPCLQPLVSSATTAAATTTTTTTSTENNNNNNKTSPTTLLPMNPITKAKASICDCCTNSNNHFQIQLQRVVDAINDGRLLKVVDDEYDDDDDDDDTLNPDNNKNDTVSNGNRNTTTTTTIPHKNHLTIPDLEQLLKL